MNYQLEARLLEIESVCQEIRRDRDAKRPTQMETLFSGGGGSALPYVLLAPDGSRVSVLVRVITDTSTGGPKSFDLRVSTTGAPQPAKGE